MLIYSNNNLNLFIVSENSLFPRRSDIFKGSTLDIRDLLVEYLDTLYQVTFSFGKSREWLREDESGKKELRELISKEKCLCYTQTEIPAQVLQLILQLVIKDSRVVSKS